MLLSAIWWSRRRLQEHTSGLAPHGPAARSLLFCKGRDVGFSRGVAPCAPHVVSVPVTKRSGVWQLRTIRGVVRDLSFSWHFQESGLKAGHEGFFGVTGRTALSAKLAPSNIKCFYLLRGGAEGDSRNKLTGLAPNGPAARPLRAFFARGAPPAPSVQVASMVHHVELHLCFSRIHQACHSFRSYI